ncbi:hypothetical protein ACH5RR_009201 [Cinchona calisaya]|uniref:Uncharacterized protein n=1 Tax=Cinchona calisaya TaxID=153742 RepID=A0ABD3AFA4_9GENT
MIGRQIYRPYLNFTKIVARDVDVVGVVAHSSRAAHVDIGVAAKYSVATSEVNDVGKLIGNNLIATHDSEINVSDVLSSSNLAPSCRKLSGGFFIATKYGENFVATTKSQMSVSATVLNDTIATRDNLQLCLLMKEIRIVLATKEDFEVDKKSKVRTTTTILCLPMQSKNKESIIQQSKNRISRGQRNLPIGLSRAPNQHFEEALSDDNGEPMVHVDHGFVSTLLVDPNGSKNRDEFGGTQIIDEMDRA